MIPAPWHALVLALAAYRLARLIGWDEFPPVAKLRAWATGQYTSKGPYVDGNHLLYRRPLLEHFLTCPFCQGFWTSVIVYLAWRFAPVETLYACAPFALSAAVGLISKNLDP